MNGPAEKQRLSWESHSWRQTLEEEGHLFRWRAQNMVTDEKGKLPQPLDYGLVPGGVFVAVFGLASACGLAYREAQQPAAQRPALTHEQEVHRNYEAFKLLLPSLLPLHRDQYALMQGGEILDFYGTCAAGYAAGVERYGRGGWSLQKVTDEVICIYSAISGGTGSEGGAP